MYICYIIKRKLTIFSLLKFCDSTFNNANVKHIFCWCTPANRPTNVKTRNFPRWRCALLDFDKCIRIKLRKFMMWKVTVGQVAPYDEISLCLISLRLERKRQISRGECFMGAYLFTSILQTFHQTLLLSRDEF